MPRNSAERVFSRPTGPQLESFLRRATQIAILAVALLIFAYAARQAQTFLAPFALAFVVGLMFGPVADRIERLGIPPAISAAAVLILFIVLIAAIFFGIAVPLSQWAGQLPEIWNKVQAELYKWQGTLAAIESVQEAVQGLGADEGPVEVTVSEGSAVQSAAMLAPAVLAQAGIFLVAMYFLLATRRQIQIAILRVAYTRRLRWRIGRIFFSVEAAVSRFLLSVTVINIGLGAAVAVAMFLIGMPSPLLWGGLAFLFNYVVFIGTAALSVMLLVAALGTLDSATMALVPVGVYLALNFIEAQFVTPAVLGRMLTLNPFIVFFTVTFWIWLWGPIGGFVAMPFLLIAVVTLRQFGMMGGGAVAVPEKGAAGPAPSLLLDRQKRRT